MAHEADPANAELKADHHAAKGTYAEGKKDLPAFTMSGTFPAKRGIAGLETYSGLLQADFDHLAAKGFDLAELKTRLDDGRMALFCMESPSGDGLKLAILVDSGSEEHAEAFLAMQRYCVATYGIEPDGACKDVSRLCFLPSDPDLCINEDATPLDWRAWPEPTVEVVADEEDEDASRLPLDAFPDTMQRLATPCEAVYQVDAALPAVSALAVMSAAFGGAVRCAGATNGRETPCNLFTVIGAPSGYGKGVCGAHCKATDGCQPQASRPMA